MATRRLRVALWQRRRSLWRQAVAQERVAWHLIDLAAILRAVANQGTHRALLG